MKQHEISAFTLEQDSRAAAEALATGLGGADTRAVVFFCTHRHDGALISRILRERLPGAEVVGCTTAGAFVQDRGAEAGVSAFAFPATSVGKAAAALARFGGGVDAGVAEAAQQLTAATGKPLRGLDPARWVGLMLVEGLKGSEEQANVAIGNAAPLVSFVGGSAGDGGEFRETRVFVNGEESNDGAALLLLEMKGPFTIMKTCSFVATDKRFTVTKADVANRVVYELDGKPVIEAYAAAVGVEPAKLGGEVFMKSPLGLVLDGEPWIRSPQKTLPDGGLKFYCQIEEGMAIHVMQSTDLVGDTRAAVERARQGLGTPAAGAVMFSCILRRLELDAANKHAEFLQAFAGTPTAGFHTYGESYLGHINQTCVGLLFG